MSVYVMFTFCYVNVYGRIMAEACGLWHLTAENRARSSAAFVLLLSLERAALICWTDVEVIQNRL